ncbi:SMP-30/gluconolactonase/LRE family protein [Mycobacterium spongiae]|nr:SMP-30/gluconolactonase/LRE family protein [Mycobacterium spongiae]
MPAEIECVYEGHDGLGESPLWVAEERSLYWSDHVGCTIKRWNPTTGEATIWDTPGPVGAFALRQQGGMVGASDAGFLAIDLSGDRYQAVVDPEADMPHNRFNDGKCDRQGRFWCGSMNKNIEDETGSIYRLDSDWSVHKLAPDFRFKVSNGTAFDPESTRMYFADTLGNTVYVFDFDADSGTISNRREFFSTHARPGMVDGGTVDEEGYYWCALVAGGQILRIDPNGRLVSEITMPIPRPTCPTFGGDNYDVLYVTSQRLFLTDNELKKYPQSGSLFAIYGLGVRGLAEGRFAG